MLRSVRELLKLKVTGADGSICGRIKDVYFDDRSWQITHFVLSNSFPKNPRHFAAKHVLVAPSLLDSTGDELNLNLTRTEIELLPHSRSVAPVCRQYASFACSSPRSRTFHQPGAEANPHLRSFNAVLAYQLTPASTSARALTDFLADNDTWQIRYLAIEQLLQGKQLHFHILPQAVERFTGATQRICLKQLQPVHLEHGPNQADQLDISTAA